MKYISKEQLLQTAGNYLQKYALLPEFQGKTIYKIEPEIMAEKVLSLQLTHHKLSRNMSILGFSTSASEIGLRIYDFAGEAVFMMINPQTIVVDSDLKDMNIGRYHFTIMHEVAHHIINRVFYSGTNKAPHFYRSVGSGDMEEWQADVLASYLLMPRECVERGMCLFDIDERKLIGLRLPQTKERIALLADFLGASKQALKIRLTDLGYIRDIIVDPPIMEEV